MKQVITAVLAVAMLLVAGCRQRPATAPVTLNVVLVTLDTLRADRLGCYGYAAARTPVLDAFASSSLLFEQATTASNNTLPSHVAILCGQHPRRLGVPRNGFEVPPTQRGLAVLLAERGYETAAFVSCSVLDATSGLRKGFAVYDDEFDIEEVDQEQRRAPETVQRALHWLNTPTTKPRFLWLHCFDPHYPYTPPPPYDRMFYPEYSGPADGSIRFIAGILGSHGFPKIRSGPDDYRRLAALYDGEIAFLDASLAPLFAYLDRPEVRAHTAVAVVADHGESLTEHGYYFDHGLDVYQPSMHVPLMVRAPGRSTGRRIAAPVQTVDIFPTLLRLAGLDVPSAADGRDLSLLGIGKKIPVAIAFGEACQPFEVETAESRAWRNDAKAQFALAWPWKLIQVPYLGRNELYRLDTDGIESHDIATAHPQMRAWLSEQLQNWRRGAAVDAQRPNPANLDKIRSLGYL
ncbi:MAG: sulfatase-like hydrolase/transferase [Candidatus Aminicenantes bacterium]|nr:sulfatase-like hydrolase/transferase [Candidatus Aminicenantes bacterium]